MTPTPGRILLDTNVLIQLIRGNAVGERIDADYNLRFRTDRPLISLVTVGELRGLALKLGWQAPKLTALQHLVSELVIVRPDQGTVIDRYAEIYTHCERDQKPARPMGQNDMWIAATASASNATLLTTDGDFGHLQPKFIALVQLDARTGATI